MTAQPARARRARRPHVRSAAGSQSAQPNVADTGARSLAARGPARIRGLDALRGIAIVAMIGYHFAFDLRHFGFTRSDFEHDPRWLTARALILSSFLLIAGISAVLARAAGPTRGWLRHVALVAGAALLVSAASWLMFPRSFIWFGVLHAIALSLVVAHALIDRPILAGLVGLGIVAAGATLAHPAFDNRVLGWLGFMTAKPLTEDYVPMFPWTGVVLIGVAAGHWLAQRRFAMLLPLARAPLALQWMGRHSLVLYLVHQPLMIGVLWLVANR